MIPIWYGNPDVNKVFLAKKDKIVLGGPVEKKYTHYCYFCQQTYPLSED
jgi:hypothetical protein